MQQIIIMTRSGVLLITPLVPTASFFLCWCESYSALALDDSFCWFWLQARFGGSSAALVRQVQLINLT